MKEQVITPRAGRGAGGGAGGGRARSGGIVQRPARRERNASAQSGGARSGLKQVLGYLPLVTKVVLAIIAGVLIFEGYRAAASASFFQVRSVDVSGTSRVSAEDVKAVVKRATQSAGVWRADLGALSRELERLPWVRHAIVSRVLPDGLRVRIIEREQRAVVRTSEGRLIWVDDDAVMLGTLQSSDRMPPFFIRGWDEAGTDAARAENRARVEKYLEMLREWEKLGLTARVSEVNLIDLSDVRVQLAGDDARIEVRLGSQEQDARLKKALTVLDAQRQTARGPLISYIDLSQGKRAIVGLTTGNHTVADGAESPPQR